MKKNEIMENVQLNEEGRKMRLFLVLAASLLAVGAAIFGLFRFGKSAKAEAKKARRTGKKKHAAAHEHTAREHKNPASETSAPVVQTVQVPVAQPQQPVYIVRPLPEKKPVSRAKRFRRRMCASVAAILVLSVVASDTLHYIPVPQIIAKESFSGISQVVSDHTDEPFVILNIVPNSGTGTIGYLTNGQQIATQLAATFKGNNYLNYNERKDEASRASIGVDGSSGYMGLKYEERYQGVDDVSGSDWIKVFGASPYSLASADALDPDAVSGVAEVAAADASDKATGYFYAEVEYSENGGPGYNFDPVVGSDNKFTKGRNARSIMRAPDGAYKISPNGEWAYKLSENGNYVVVGDELSEAYLSSWVYVNEGGVWVWVGMTLDELLAERFPDNGENSKGPEIEEEDPEEEDPEEEPDGDDDQTPGDGDDDQTPGDGDDDQTPGDGDGDQTPGDGDGNQTPGDGDGDQTPGGGDNNQTPSSGDGDQNSEGSADNSSSAEHEAVPENIIDARNTGVLGRWYKLVDDGEEASTEEDVEYTLSLDDKLGILRGDGYAVVFFEYTEEKTDEDGNPLQLYDPILNEGYEEYEADNLFATLEASDEGTMLFATNDQVDGRFMYVGTGGHYKLRRLNKDSNSVSLDNQGWVVVQGVGVYFRIKGAEDYLKKYVFSTLSGGDNPNSDFSIEVITKRADQVELEDIFSADLIYMEDGTNNASATAGEFFYDPDSDPARDMDAGAVSAILSRATQELLPIIVDYGVAKGAGYEKSNYSYLAKAMLKKDLAEFYHAVNTGSGKNLIDNIILSLKDEDKYPSKKDNDYHYVNKNIYVVNNSTLVDDGFAEAFDEENAKRGFSEVLTAIKAENIMLSEDNKIKEEVSKAKAVQYIINYSVGMIGEFDNLTILELQPTANIVSDLSTETDSKGYAKLLWKTQSMTAAKQVLSSKKEFSVVKDIKSVAEFNGEWEDLNSTYDFIFIGLDGQRLNRGNGGKAQYNNSSLNGKVYHSGDDSGVGKYDANDITPQKMTDLIEYLKAGYPIVVEDDFFKEGSAQSAKSNDINTDYIGDDTFMYRFLQVALSDYKDCIYSVSDTMSSAMFMTEVRLAKPVVNVIDETGNAAGKLQTLVKGENGEYRGIINYEIKNRQGDDYQGETLINLYVDYNFDGMFTVEELVTEYAGGSGTIDVAADGMDAGILPWKLEVTDANNTNRRDSVQGYFVPSSPAEGELKVLQVTEKLNDDNVNLQRIFQYENSLLAYYLHSAESSTNTTMQFETVSTSQLETLLSENAKYLELYDVVVLTMDGSAESGVVTQAVSDYVDAGRSLLVCNQGVETPMARMGLSAELLGQTDNGTFTNLGFSSGLTYFRYAGLTRDMFEATTLLSAEPINEGSISYYPYQLGTNIAFGERASLQASPYLLDFDGNLASEPNATYVTAWYTFGSTTEASAYGISPRDARNNYYCYSKGNVVYLAQSEYPYTYDSKDTSTAAGEGAGESMMFVNALMAAYNAGVHNANIHIVAGFAADSAEIESIAVPFDDIWLEAGDSTAGILDNTVDVYFRFRDTNVARNKTMLITFLYQDPTGPELDIGGRVVNARPFGSQLWTVENSRLTLIGDVGAEGLTLTGDNQLKTGQTYRIKAPVVTLKGNENMNKADIYIVVQTSFTKSGRDCNVISSDVVSLNRAQLFLLE